MKMWIIGLALIGLIAITGFIAANLSSDGGSEFFKGESSNEIETCPLGGCTQESNCGLSGCGALEGKSCGCGRG